MPDTPTIVSTKNQLSLCNNIAERAFQSLAARRASFLIWDAGRASGPTRAGEIATGCTAIYRVRQQKRSGILAPIDRLLRRSASRPSASSARDWAPS